MFKPMPISYVLVIAHESLGGTKLGVIELPNHVLPTVDVCSDGSFCCDNDPGCCAAGRGAVMDESK